MIIGNHFPEFFHEQDLNNLQAALQRLEVPHAVTRDNDARTWRAYHNRYWPTLYLIGKRGEVRYQRIGEGGYAETEAAIQALLAATYPYVPAGCHSGRRHGGQAAGLNPATRRL